MDEKLILLGVAAVCVGLYFWGSQIDQENKYLKYLPTIGSLIFGLNTLIQIARSKEDKTSPAEKQTQTKSKY